MLKNKKSNFYVSALFLILFITWTAAVCLIDRRPIGAGGTHIGFATINEYVHRLCGVHMSLYTLTDTLSVIPIGIMLLNAAAGLVQWIRRKDIRRIDGAILYAGVIYAILFAVFIVFEIFPVNFRPILINGSLEASYPSSTTMLTMTVMICGILQVRSGFRPTVIRRLCEIVFVFFTVFMVAARIVSGVHWFTDIIGGVLVSLSLSASYAYMLQKRAR